MAEQPNQEHLQYQQWYYRNDKYPFYPDYQFQTWAKYSYDESRVLAYYLKNGAACAHVGDYVVDFVRMQQVHALDHYRVRLVRWENVTAKNEENCYFCQDCGEQVQLEMKRAHSRFACQAGFIGSILGRKTFLDKGQAIQYYMINPKQIEVVDTSTKGTATRENLFGSTKKRVLGKKAPRSTKLVDERQVKQKRQKVTHKINEDSPTIVTTNDLTEKAQEQQVKKGRLKRLPQVMNKTPRGKKKMRIRLCKAGRKQETTKFI